MKARRFFLLGTAIIPFAVFSAQQNPPPTCEQVYKNIKVMNGVPASDMIPAMDQIGTDREMTSPEPWNCWGDLRP